MSTAWQNLGNLWLAMIALMVGCVQFFGQTRPAVILVLASSNPRALRLHRKLSDDLFPHRAISLLETGNFREDRTVVAGNCYRITMGNWKDAVWRFARCALVVVVDIREMTPAVREELEFVVREELQFKTIILKSLEQCLPDERLNQCCVVQTEAQCAAVVERAFDPSNELPSDDRPICSALFSDG